ncbi:MAG: sigma-70 family RNA polymerase sigma factor [Lachnospiraceae bacterium]|nr:sigma-70 family RNA polymerase sigma factor [Lachnospiraceae bacterium]
MEDKQIVDLFYERSEEALTHMQNKYKRYAGSIAYNILNNVEDAKECVNSAYYKVWNSIPPHKPENLATYLGKIVRNTALDMFEKFNAKKRGGSSVELALEELSDCIPSVEKVEGLVDDIVLKDILNQFLSELPVDNRKVFVKRYWYLCSIKDIAKQCGLSESKVKMTLLRTREKLKTTLQNGEII